MGVPPYNVGWMLRLSAAEKIWLAANPVVVCDVGARGAAPGELEPFSPYLVLHAFDADPKAAATLNDMPSRYKNRRVFAGMVGRSSGRGEFHVYKGPGQSSVYLPSASYREAFAGDDFSVAETIETEVESLDDIHAREKLPYPHLLKLDTQGSELGILCGAEDTLVHSLLVESEVEFTSMYEGQPLFHDVAAHLYDRGFELLYLNRCFQQRANVYKGHARGQVVFADALFGRRLDFVQSEIFDTTQLVIYALLLANYGHVDLAAQLAAEHPKILNELPELGQRLNGRRRNRAGQLLVSQLDKLAFIWLAMRRSNWMNNDSDRSWPVR